MTIFADDMNRRIATETTNQPTDRLINRPAEQPTDRPTDRLAGRQPCTSTWHYISGLESDRRCACRAAQCGAAQFSSAHLFEPVRFVLEPNELEREPRGQSLSSEHLSSLFLSHTHAPRSFALCLSRFSPSCRQSAFHALPEYSFISCTSPFIEGAYYQIY